MRTTPRLAFALASAAAMLLSGSVAYAAPASGLPGSGSAGVHGAEYLDWGPCPTDPTAQCGTLSVPVDWAQPAGARVELALARRPATDPAARIGALVVNPGGPGGSGVDSVLDDSDLFTPRLRERFDLVGFDPRGVGRSHPVRCSVELVQQMPEVLLDSQRAFERMVDYNRTLGEDCRARTGPLFDHVDTLSVVKDLEAIRSALGESRLTYYGLSYGTLLGQQYAAQFPHRVRALALDGVVDHSLGTLGFLATQALAMQESFAEFAAWCDRTLRCALHGEDISVLWAELHTAAERGELIDPEFPDFPIGPLGLSFFAMLSLREVQWAELAEFLAALETGEPSGAAAPLEVNAAPTPGVTGELVSGPPLADDEIAHPFPAIFCQDWHLPVRDHRQFARHMQITGWVAPDMRYSPLAVNSLVSCLGWPSEVTNPQRRLQVPHGPELLLTNARYDPSTPYQWAVNVERQLRGSGMLLTYQGWGHEMYGHVDCVTGAVDDYLISRAVPEPDASCPAVPPEAGASR